MKYKVSLIKEYIAIADSKEESIKSAKFDFYQSNNSSFCQQWDKVQCKEYEEIKNKCKKCKYYRNPDYIRCHKCKQKSRNK
jgi:hypothetical protein